METQQRAHDQNRKSASFWATVTVLRLELTILNRCGKSSALHKEEKVKWRSGSVTLALVEAFTVTVTGRGCIKKKQQGPTEILWNFNHARTKSWPFLNKQEHNCTFEPIGGIYSTTHQMRRDMTTSYNHEFILTSARRRLLNRRSNIDSHHSSPTCSEREGAARGRSVNCILQPHH